MLDGALGTELEAAGLDTAGTDWSARPLRSAATCGAIAALHHAYADAGATVHTAATFRTTARAYGDGWHEALDRAVGLAREAVPAGHRVAGSLAPCEDCWHPERSPPTAAAEHRATAAALARAGVDLILCETFTPGNEARAAIDAALGTGLPVWVSFTSGPHDALSSPAAVASAARAAAQAGAERVLLNCVPADRCARYLDALAASGRPFGVYANGGLGPARLRPEVYAARALEWVAAGATAVGGCCGAGPAHIRAVVGALGSR